MSASGVDRASLRAENLERLVTDEAFFFEHYFERLKDWTFPSEWFALDDADCRALTSIRAQRLRGDDSSGSERQLASLAAKIDACMARLPGDGTKHAVVRLSTRSAKDVVLFRDSTVELFFDEDRRLQADASFTGCREDVRQLIAMMRAAGRAMAVTCGADALQLFVESERIGSDLREHLRLKKAGHAAPAINVIVRQYVPLACELELRVFVADRRIAAISQYYASLTVPRLIAERQAVESRVFDAFERLLPCVQLTDFVIDFAFDRDADRLWVVEINLPPPVAGMAMFDRNSSADIDTVAGRRPYEFRVRTAPSDADGDLRLKHQLFFQKVSDARRRRDQQLPPRTTVRHRRLGSG